MSIKVHLGCGDKYLDGFVHIDMAAYDHIDYQRDVRDLSCFEDNSVSLIYACHVLEYFDLQEAVDVLKEWQRALKPGGILRLAVPDFAAMVRVYQRYGDLSLIHGPLYGRWMIRTAMGEKMIYHHAVYDFDALRAVLESVGFQNVHRYNWRETIHKDYDDYSQAYIPHMDKERGILISLNLEAEKPQRL